MDSGEVRTPLRDVAPLALTPDAGGEDVAVAPDATGDLPVLLLLGDGPEARAVARLAGECGFVVDMAVWPAPGTPEMAPPETEAGPEMAADPAAAAGTEAPGAPGAPGADVPEMPGLRRRMLLLPDDGLVERCGIGRRHHVCIFPPDAATARRALEDVLASHAFYVGLWVTRAGRDRIWAELREAGVPDAELAAVRCPLGLGELAVGAATPVASAVVILAELLAARAGSLQRFRLED
ncbi:XdhC family protein [uncultured Desulfovibrio sp.]|uniref:XdhC family protein n=1 Tax=uncultured Desulfovibrio sp. TaxID=167968 RepID=UPI00260BC762|nr:XdhC family protein [uncultured Desulfovibrio sp.]